MALYPDAVVDFVLEQLAYEGTSGTSWDRLWVIVGEKYPLDELYKSMIYSWIRDNANIEHLDASGKKLIYAPVSCHAAKDVLVKVTDEYAWIALTGAPQKNNSVPNSSFQLLSAIAQTRSEGIDSLALIQVTKQDNRSLTSRIKKISHLIKKVQITKNGRLLQLFILLKMFDEDKLKGLSVPSRNNELAIQIGELKEKIVKATKEARSGLRQVLDLRRELEMDKTPKLCTVFRSSVNYLEATGHIAKVLVVSPVSPTNKIRAIKFLKDYTTNDDNIDLEEEEDEEIPFNNDLVDDQLKEMDEEEGSAPLKNMVDLQVVDSIANTTELPGFNRFYPFQNQLFEIANNRGTAGVAAPELLDLMFGRQCSRLFSKLVEYYTSGKFIAHIANYGIVRHYDFKGRSKFYRYLSRPNLLSLSSQPPDPQGSSLPKLNLSGYSLKELNKKMYCPLISRPTVDVDENGTRSINWFGASDFSQSAPLTPVDPSAPPKRKRGRPKKGEEKPKAEKKSKQVRKLEPVAKPVAAEVIQNTAGDGSLVISDIQGHSFRSIERLSAILRVLDDHDGVIENNRIFRDEINNELGFNVDKKTFHNDVNSLVDQKKIRLEEFALEDGSTKNLVIGVHATFAAIEHYKRMLLTADKKHSTTKKLEQVNADVDFFDMELRDTFITVKDTSKPSEPSTGPPKGSKLQVKTEKKPVKAKAKDLETHLETPTEASTQTGSSTNFDDLLVRKKRARVEPVSSTRVGRKRRSGQLDSESMMLLFKAVIICKTLNENQIDWVKISDLEPFKGIPPDELRARWPRIRMMMGSNGIQVARRTWKRMLLHELRQGNILPEAVEEMDVEAMLSCWNNDVVPLGTLDDSGEKLFVDVEDNFKHYNFVKAESSHTDGQYDSNSMVQRENFLVGKVFTYSDKDDEPSKEMTKEDLIRNIIIAIVASEQKFELNKLSSLEHFTKEEVDKVFLKMSKKREIVVSGDSKVLLGDRLSSVIEDNSYDYSLEKVSKFQKLLKELCSHDKGLVLDPVFDNSCMVPILELIKDNSLNLTRVDHYRKEVLNGYEARTLEREKLDCDIILSKGSTEIRGVPEKSVPVPHGKPCSRIWIDVNGEINRTLWFKVVRAMLTTVLSHPGITLSGISEAMTPLLTLEEVKLVLQWLVDSHSIKRGEMCGYWLESQWYMVL
jgi:transcription factor C subunit 3